MRSSLLFFFFMMLFTALWLGCSGDDPADGDGDADSDSDSDGDETPTTCSSDGACDDGEFCNGVERCDPEAEGADGLGCIAAVDAPCGENEVCDEDDDECVVDDCLEPDRDGDSHDRTSCGGDDCDDDDSIRFPGNPEICDADDHDEDCNDRTFGFSDLDDDGYVDSECCNLAEDGTPYCGDDCNDLRRVSHPGNTEACDGFDNDCDGEIDEDVLIEFWIDEDGDGFGSAEPGAETIEDCNVVPGYSDNHTDCDDANGEVHPAASEICDLQDNNCDGDTDPGCACIDGETIPCGTDEGECVMGLQLCVDGFFTTCGGGTEPTPEVCNDLDDDCDSEIDEGVLRTYHFDNDDDGYGDPDITVLGCSLPSDYVVDGSDCDDDDLEIHPGAVESCDGDDNNCDGLTDPGCECEDGDTIVCGTDVGECEFGTQLCIGGRYGTCGGGVSPASEVCNGQDDDCNDEIDNGVLNIYYLDDDNDGYGDGDVNVTGCSPPTDYIVDGTDCDDSDGDVHPGAIEECDTVDNNCDGSTDPGCLCVDGLTAICGIDTGACQTGIQTCIDGGWGPCVGEIIPVDETCNGVDDDCDGDIDEGRLHTYCNDADGDLYGNPALSETGCEPSDGYIEQCTDCNDGNANIHPTADELCDRLDNNCSSGGGSANGEDYDDDGYAPIGGSCSGGPFPETDCNDHNDDVNPGQTEYFGTGLCASDEYYCDSIQQCCEDFSPCLDAICGDADFDYNCDSSETPEPDASTCAVAGEIFHYCTGGGPIPGTFSSCGEDVFYRICTYNILTGDCEESADVRPYPCH